MSFSVTNWLPLVLDTPWLILSYTYSCWPLYTWSRFSLIIRTSTSRFTSLSKDHPHSHSRHSVCCVPICTIHLQDFPRKKAAFETIQFTLRISRCKLACLLQNHRNKRLIAFHQLASKSSICSRRRATHSCDVCCGLNFETFTLARDIDRKHPV